MSRDSGPPELKTIPESGNQFALTACCPCEKIAEHLGSPLRVALVIVMPLLGARIALARAVAPGASVVRTVYVVKTVCKHPW